MLTKPISILASIVAITTSFVPASRAEPVTYACKIASSNTEGSRFTDADQLVIDVQDQSADLRVAKTMNTSEPVNWLFKTRSLDVDADAFHIATVAGDIVGSGFYGYTPHSFILRRNGTLDWTFLSGSYNRPVIMQWNCRRQLEHNPRLARH